MYCAVSRIFVSYNPLSPLAELASCSYSNCYSQQQYVSPILSAAVRFSHTLSSSTFLPYSQQQYVSPILSAAVRFSHTLSSSMFLPYYDKSAAVAVAVGSWGSVQPTPQKERTFWNAFILVWFTFQDGMSDCSTRPSSLLPSI